MVKARVKDITREGIIDAMVKARADAMIRARDKDIARKEGITVANDGAMGKARVKALLNYPDNAGIPISNPWLQVELDALSKRDSENVKAFGVYRWNVGFYAGFEAAWKARAPKRKRAVKATA